MNNSAPMLPANTTEFMNAMIYRNVDDMRDIYTSNCESYSKLWTKCMDYVNASQPNDQSCMHASHFYTTSQQHILADLSQLYINMCDLDDEFAIGCLSCMFELFDDELFGIVFKKTFLMYCRKGRCNMIQWLLIFMDTIGQCHVNLLAEGMCVACSSGHIRVVKLLHTVDSGTCNNDDGGQYITMFKRACVSGHIDIAEWIINASADNIYFADICDMKTIIWKYHNDDLVINVCDACRIDVISWLVDNIPHIDICASNNAALWNAVKNEHACMIGYLLYHMPIRDLDTLFLCASATPTDECFRMVYLITTVCVNRYEIEQCYDSDEILGVRIIPNNGTFDDYITECVEATFVELGNVGYDRYNLSI